MSTMTPANTAPSRSTPPTWHARTGQGVAAGSPCPPRAMVAEGARGHQMGIAVAQPGRLTERRWPMLVGRGCASAEARFALIAERLVDAAGLRAGDAVLDVATGSGEAAIAAARCGCVVTGVGDIVAALSARARERAGRRGTRRHVRGGRRGATALSGCSFDAVLSCCGRDVHARPCAGGDASLCACAGRVGRSRLPTGLWPGSSAGCSKPSPLTFQAASLMWPPGLWGTRGAPSAALTAMLWRT